MTRLGDEMNRLKNENKAVNSQKSSELKTVVDELYVKLRDVFEGSLSGDETIYSSNLAKIVALKQPEILCVIDDKGAQLTVNFNLYLKGRLSLLNEDSIELIMSSATALLREYYPEYSFKCKYRSIYISDTPPAAKGFVEWIVSLFKKPEQRH